MFLKFLLATLSVAAVIVVVAVIGLGVREGMHRATSARYDVGLLMFREPGTGQISKQRAMAVAEGPGGVFAHHGDRASARYGLFSAATPCRASNHGCIPELHRTPAWVVVLAGPDECEPGGGPPAVVPPPTLTPAQKDSCRMTWVISAKTGRPLLSFN